ncbi:MAG TPA: exodeoxyribonuclease VII large subunit [Verrucomicrobiae bacterium]|nr:exodeoxyribonuclease VII large subunit [Verrucomicrobiae bacterium]
MQILTVSQFVTYLNDTFKAIWDATGVAVEGEVSNFRVSQGQWVNFDLKDDESLVSCFMVLNKLRLPVEDGMRVRLFGYPRVYPKFGKFSFNVDRVELVGEGALKKALAMLKAKLEAEGLFDFSRKRTLPRFPKSIALIASRESAAYGDFIRIVNERWSGLEIDLYHAIVQGEKAPGSVMAGLAAANKHGDYDAIVITRGGGSFDELMAFNDERLVRAVYASKIPTMVAIGHERDVSLCELAADVHASTPTDCARRLVPDKRDVLFELSRLDERIAGEVERRVELYRDTLERAQSGAARWLEMLRVRLDSLRRLITSFSPEAVLKRGFAIVTDQAGDVISSVKDAKPGLAVAIRLRDGEAGARIEGKQGTLI